MNVEAEDVLTLSVDSKGRVTIPAEARNELGIDEDTDVELAILGTSDVESEKEAFAKEIHEMTIRLSNAMFKEDDMPDSDEKVALRLIEQRLHEEYS